MQLELHMVHGELKDGHADLTKLAVLGIFFVSSPTGLRTFKVLRILYH
jgi:hypothetical protein